MLQLLEKINSLQSKLKKPIKERISDLRLAMNYSRNTEGFLTTTDCWFVHREITALYDQSKDYKPLKFQIDKKLNLKVQRALGEARAINYQKSYDY